MNALPDLFTCIDPALGEIRDVRVLLDSAITDLLDARGDKLTISVGLTAANVALRAKQIHELAAAVHRGVAKRLELGPIT